MTDTNETACRDCGKPLAAGLRVMGMPYCEGCVRARTLYCHTCRTPLKPEDFATGRAVTLLGRRFCEGCLESAVQQGRERAASDPSNQAVRTGSKPSLEDSQDVDSIAIRRLYGRYVAHSDAVLVVKAPGLKALLGNRVRLWLDVSEGGFRAILKGDYELEERVAGSISFNPTKKVYPFESTIKHVRASQRYPGCTLVGARFDHPSRELQSFIMGKMSQRPVMIPSPPSGSTPKVRNKPASTSFPPPTPARV